METLGTPELAANKGVGDRWGGGAGYIQPRSLARYLGRLTVSQGRRNRRTFQTLYPGKPRFVRGAFVPDVFNRPPCPWGAGTAKTALLSGIAAATLDGPLMVPRGETLIVASSFEQARIAFEHVLAFMGDKLDDRDRWKVWDTAQQARIEDRKTKGAGAVPRLRSSPGARSRACPGPGR